MTGAVTAERFAAPTFGPSDVTECVSVLRDAARAVSAGDMSGPEAMLLGQAAALNSLFTDLTRRSVMNINTHLEAADRFMRLALKAQAQCRAAVEALATLKSPRNRPSQRRRNFNVLRRGYKAKESRKVKTSDARHENANTVFRPRAKASPQPSVPVWPQPGPSGRTDNRA